MQRAALSYDAVLADVYWIRALQHFGRRAPEANPRTGSYDLLYPLLDLTTTLDPRSPSGTGSARSSSPSRTLAAPAGPTRRSRC